MKVSYLDKKFYLFYTWVSKDGFRVSFHDFVEIEHVSSNAVRSPLVFLHPMPMPILTVVASALLVFFLVDAIVTFALIGFHDVLIGHSFAAPIVASAWNDVDNASLVTSVAKPAPVSVTIKAVDLSIFFCLTGFAVTFFFGFNKVSSGSLCNICLVTGYT